MRRDSKKKKSQLTGNIERSVRPSDFRRHRWLVLLLLVVPRIRRTVIGHTGGGLHRHVNRIFSTVNGRALTTVAPRPRAAIADAAVRSGGTDHGRRSGQPLSGGLGHRLHLDIRNLELWGSRQRVMLQLLLAQMLLLT